MELSLLYLGDKSILFERLKNPGAQHKARWTYKILYFIRIVVFNPQIAKTNGAQVCANDTQLTKFSVILSTS